MIQQVHILVTLPCQWAHRSNEQGKKGAENGLQSIYYDH